MSGLTDGQMGRLWEAEVAGESLLPVVAALIIEAAKRARADTWDECVDRICSANESGTANNARFKRANPYREARS